MSTTTPLRGFTVPSPDGSDGLGDWSAIVYQLGVDVENSSFLNVDAHAAADLFSQYPVGITLMRITTAGATSGSWPSGGTVLTHQIGGGGQTHQMLFGLSINASVLWRGASNGPWTPWYTLGGVASPSAMATGQITLTPPTGGGTIVGTVLFPTARFTAPPRVQLTAVTTTPGNVAISMNSVPTSSQVQVALSRTDAATPTSIQWTATQGVDS